MERIEIQRKVLSIIAILLLLSGLSQIVVLPAILLDNSPDSVPMQAAGGNLIGISLHLFLAFLFGMRLRRSRTVLRNEVYILSAVGLFFLGFMILDGAFAFRDDVPFVSIGFFLCSFFDLAAALVFVTALFLLRKKKKN